MTVFCGVQRVGYVLFFIIGAFYWGNLLAEVGEIHACMSVRQTKKTERIQETLDFLHDIDCPHALQVEIIQVS